MKRRIYRIPRKFLFLLTMLYGIVMQAQNVTVSGTVVSADDSMGLPGVNVVVKGTTTGTVTDFDGNYSIVAPSANSTLVFTYIGFTAQEIPINGKTQLDVIMSEDAAALDEVVVVGYGTQIKRQVTGSVSTIQAEELADIPVSQITQKYRVGFLGFRLIRAQVNLARVCRFVFVGNYPFPEEVTHCMWLMASPFLVESTI